MSKSKNNKLIEEELKSKSTKSKVVKNLKVSLKVAQLVAPYVISLGIPVGLFKISGKGIPFKLETIKHAPVIMKEFDSFGNENIKKQYSSFSLSPNVVRHYTEFNKEDNGVYTRQIENYSFDNEDLDKIEELMKTDIDYDKLTEVLGKPGLIVTETKNNPTNKELKTRDYLEAEAYSYDYDNVLIEKETKQEDRLLTIFEGIIFILEAAGITAFRISRKYSFQKQNDDVTEKNNHEHGQEITNKQLVK